MNYRVQEVGYKVVKLGRHTVSCSLSALGAIFAIGALSTFAHSANAQSAPSVVDLDSFFSSPSSNLTVTQGSGSTGYMVGGAENGAFFTQAGRGFTGDATGTYTDFYTVGGNGSGGGAGLGGAFYVDIDGDLTMRDVQFTGNVARGGTGGGVTPVALRAAAIGLTEREASIASAVSFNITPTDLSGSSFSKLELEEANTRFAVGQKVRVDGAIGVSTIEAINGNEITLKSSLTVDNSSVQSLSASISGQTITGQALTDLGSSASFAVGSLVLGNGVPAGTTLTSVTRNNDNLITSMTLSDSATVSGANNLQFINLPKVEAAQYVSLGAAGTVYLEDNTTVDTARSGLYRIEASAAALGLTVGMELTGNGVPVGTKVTAIDTTSDAGTDIVYLSTVDSSNPLEALSFDGSMMVGEVGKDYIQLSTPDTRVVVGGFISGDGIPDGTRVQTYDSRTGRITLADQQGNTVNLTGIPEAVTTSAVLGQTSNSITVASAAGIAVDMEIEGDGITSGAKVASVTRLDNGNFEVTLKDGTVTGTVTGFVASSELSTGGSLNNLEVLSAYSAGTDGKDGKNGNSVLPYITDGEGLEGTPGQGANLNDNQDVDYAPGGVGGDGGDGSNGVPFNYEAIKNTKKATGEFVEKITEAAAALGNAPFPSFSTSAALITASVAKGINLTVEIINSVKWIQGMTEGTVALGGEGGEGGAGGDGGEFYGGGAGGAGGNGGAGALSYTTGGAGGSGGEGGTGGFGAGGGQGGDSGDAGPTGYALEGDPGAGGSAGFAAGEGSDGWNRFGGGGSGYGGAVFVRGSVDGTTGGNLKIEGNALFRNNYVLGGSSTNGGEAGQAAGGDLFIMKGARVDLMPGAGKTIRFEGAIADNSIASIEGGSWSAGEGADLHIGGGGLVQLAGENTYSGKTYIHGSTTEVTLGEGIYPDSSIVFEGAGNITGSGGIQPHFGAGTLFLAEDVVQRVGANVPGQISWDGAGGFSAATAEGIVLNFGRITDDGDGQKLYWGSSYIASDSTLVFGSEYSLGSVTWMNNIDLQTHTGNIVVFDSKQIDDATGEKVADLAFVRGDLTNGALRIGDTGYDGTLLLLGTNDLTGITVEEGLVLTTDGETTGRLFDTTNGGFVDVNAGGWLVLTGSETVTSVDVAQNGILMSSQGLTSDNAITNEGVMSLSGVNDLASVWNKSTGNLATNANMDVFDGNLRNDGRWDILADQTITIDDSDASTLSEGLVGNGVFCLETTGADATVCNTAAAPDADVEATDTTLTLKQAGDSTFDGEFAGLGSLIKSGAGTLSLTAAQTFLGGLTVSEGEVVAQNSATFADSLDIEVATNANLRLNVADTFGTLTSSGNTFVNADLSATSMSTTGGSLELGANVTTTGAFNLADPGTVSLVAGNRTITAGAGLTGNGDIDVGAHTLTLSQAPGAISTFRGDIVQDNSAQTGEFTLIGGGNLILAGATNQMSVSKLNIINGKLSLDGSELLIDTIDVLVDQSGTLELLNASDQAIVRTESIDSLNGTGKIELGRNTLNVENGGSFEGEFFGTGTVNVANGAFTVNNSLTSTEGGLTVSNQAGTTVSAGTNVDVDNVSVSANATLNVAGTGTANNQITRITANELTVDSYATLHLGPLPLGTGSYSSGSEDNNIVDADEMVLNGTVSGNGTLRAENITVTAASTAPRANIRPGNSPGVQNFFANTYTLGDNSRLEIEVVDSSRDAGVGYDQVRFTNPNGSLVLEGDAVLSIVDLASHTSGATSFNFDANNYALGNVTQFAVVEPSSVMGVFDTVAHTRLSANTNNFAVNLGTGSLVGLGVKNLADTATTDNEAAMIAGMKVASSGAADQYYGGKFIENLTQAWAGNHDLGTVYDKASPEIYAGVGSSAEAAVMGGAPEWMAGFLASEGKTTTFVDYGISHFRSDDNGEEFNTFGVRTSNRKVGFNISSDVATLLFNIGTTTSALQSDYLTGSGTGVNFGAAVVGEVSSIQGLSWTAGFSTRQHGA